MLRFVCYQTSDEPALRTLLCAKACYVLARIQWRREYSCSPFLGLAMETYETMAQTWTMAERLVDPYAAFGSIAKECVDLGAFNNDAAVFLIPSSATPASHAILMKRLVMLVVNLLFSVSNGTIVPVQITYVKAFKCLYPNLKEFLSLVSLIGSFLTVWAPSMRWPTS